MKYTVRYQSEHTTFQLVRICNLHLQDVYQYRAYIVYLGAYIRYRYVPSLSKNMETTNKKQIYTILLKEALRSIFYREKIFSMWSLFLEY